MAYIEMGKSEWARDRLNQLRSQFPRKALYVYWIGRLDYDGHFYPAATRAFRQAIELDPQMARAWDNLGLCLYYQNENEEALTSYRRAIELEEAQKHPSAWTYLNLAITEQFLNRNGDAEAHLRRALGIDGKLAQAHFQLGTVLEDAGKLEGALQELEAAAALDDRYAEPHMAMARLAHKLGREALARQQVEIYRKLHATAPQ